MDKSSLNSGNTRVALLPSIKSGGNLKNCRHALVGRSALPVGVFLRLHRIETPEAPDRLIHGSILPLPAKRFPLNLRGRLAERPSPVTSRTRLSFFPTPPDFLELDGIRAGVGHGLHVKQTAVLRNSGCQ